MVLAQHLRTGEPLHHILSDLVTAELWDQARVKRAAAFPPLVDTAGVAPSPRLPLGSDATGVAPPLAAALTFGMVPK